MTDSTSQSAERVTKPKRKSGASDGAKIIVAGVAVSASLLMVGAMAKAAESSSTAPTVDRVVLIELSSTSATGSTEPGSTPQQNVTVVRQRIELPAQPTSDPTPAPAESSGS